jgi:hypothetical protein
MAIDHNSGLVLVQQFDQQEFHDAGFMMSLPEGYLHFSCGEKGGADDPQASVHLNPSNGSVFFKLVYEHEVTIERKQL